MGMCCSNRGESLEDRLKTIKYNHNLKNLNWNDLTFAFLNKQIKGLMDKGYYSYIPRVYYDIVISKLFEKNGKSLIVTDEDEDCFNFLKNLYTLINEENKDNFNNIQLILFSILNNSDDKSKIILLFELLSKIKSGLNTTTNQKFILSSGNENTKEGSMNFQNFTENLIFYLTLNLGGYTNILINSIKFDDQNSVIRIKKEYKEVVSNENIKNFYFFLMKDYLKEKNLKTDSKQISSFTLSLSNLEITFIEIEKIFEKNNFLLDIVNLRSTFINYVKDNDF